MSGVTERDSKVRGFFSTHMNDYTVGVCLVLCYLLSSVKCLLPPEHIKDNNFWCYLILCATEISFRPCAHLLLPGFSEAWGGIMT